MMLKCDDNLAKIKALSKNIKVPPKKGTFADELSEEDLKLRKENRQKFYLKYQGMGSKNFGRKREFKSNWKQQQQPGGKGGRNPESDDEDQRFRPPEQTDMWKQTSNMQGGY